MTDNYREEMREARESAESKISTSVILPSSESAEELADLAEIFGWYDSPAGRDVFEEARKWLASHDAETRNQCADRYCEHKCAWPPREWKHPDECECTERAAILGEGKA